MWETIVNVHDFYSLNLWRILSGGLGWSSHTVISSYVAYRGFRFKLLAKRAIIFLSMKLVILQLLLLEVKLNINVANSAFHINSFSSLFSREKN